MNSLELGQRLVTNDQNIGSSENFCVLENCECFYEALGESYKKISYIFVSALLPFIEIEKLQNVGIFEKIQVSGALDINISDITRLQ